MSDPPNEYGFTDEQRRALDRVLDDLVPPSPDGRLPGAGEIGLAAHIESALRTMPELWAMVIQSLAALDRLATRRDARFVELAPADQVAVLEELASSADAFPAILALHTFTGYYQHARVLEALGVGAHPPHPKGYEMAPDDLSLLDPVRRRAKLYRVP